MKLSHSQGPPRCCLLESLKRSHKGQDQTWLKFWWVEHHSLYSYNMIQANSDALSYSQGAGNSCRVIVFTRQLDLELVWKFKKFTKINIKLIWDFDVENTAIKLQLDTGNLWRVITFTRSSLILPAWKFKKVIKRSRSNLFEILMSWTSLRVKLQHDTDKFWCIIIFTRSCNMLPFEHDLV